MARMLLIRIAGVAVAVGASQGLPLNTDDASVLLQNSVQENRKHPDPRVLKEAEAWPNSIGYHSKKEKGNRDQAAASAAPPSAATANLRDGIVAQAGAPSTYMEQAYEQMMQGQSPYAWPHPQEGLPYPNIVPALGPHSALDNVKDDVRPEKSAEPEIAEVVETATSVEATASQPEVVAPRENLVAEKVLTRRQRFENYRAEADKQMQDYNKFLMDKQQEGILKFNQKLRVSQQQQVDAKKQWEEEHLKQSKTEAEAADASAKGSKNDD